MMKERQTLNNKTILRHNIPTMRYRDMDIMKLILTAKEIMEYLNKVAIVKGQKPRQIRQVRRDLKDGKIKYIEKKGSPKGYVYVLMSKVLDEYEPAHPGRQGKK